MSLQSMLDTDATLRPSVRPYAPTKRRTPPASVLTPISRLELVQCQVSANPLNPRSATSVASTPRANLPPPPAGLPARPDAVLNAPPANGTVSGQKRPRRDLVESADEARKRWREGDVRTVADHCQLPTYVGDPFRSSRLTYFVVARRQCPTQHGPRSPCRLADHWPQAIQQLDQVGADRAVRSKGRRYRSANQGARSRLRQRWRPAKVGQSGD